MIRQLSPIVVSIIAAAGALGVWPSAARAQEACFTRMDNGVDLTGWRKSTTNHHGPGDDWKVENGAIVGRQTAGARGGLLMTDKTFKDVEVIFEVKIDWGCDSGFFFRTTGGDRAYQVTIDHLPDSGVGLVYGESFAQELYHHPYLLTNLGNTAVKDPALTPIFDVATWPTLWKPTAFNEIRARITGNPPRLEVWIAGVKVVDFTDPRLRPEIDAAGPLGIQVHSGNRWIANGSVQFRNIRAKDLSVPCTDNGGDGGAGDGGGRADGGATGGAGAGRTGGGGGASDAGAGGAGGGGASGAGAGGTGEGGGASGAGAAGNGGAPGGGASGGGAGATGAGSGGATGSGTGGGTSAPPPQTNSAGSGCAAAGSPSAAGSPIAYGLLSALLARRLRRRSRHATAA